MIHTEYCAVSIWLPASRCTVEIQLHAWCNWRCCFFHLLHGSKWEDLPRTIYGKVQCAATRTAVSGCFLATVSTARPDLRPHSAPVQDMILRYWLPHGELFIEWVVTWGGIPAMRLDFDCVHVASLPNSSATHLALSGREDK